MRIAVSLLAVFVYCLVIALLMYANALYLNQDPKIGENGWTGFWYGWALLYAPVFLFGVVQNWFKNKKLREYLKCNTVLVLVIALFVEFSFIKNIPWHFIIIQYVIIGIIWLYVLN